MTHRMMTLNHAIYVLDFFPNSPPCFCRITSQVTEDLDSASLILFGAFLFYSIPPSKYLICTHSHRCGLSDLNKFSKLQGCVLAVCSKSQLRFHSIARSLKSTHSVHRRLYSRSCFLTFLFQRNRYCSSNTNFHP